MSTRSSRRKSSGAAERSGTDSTDNQYSSTDAASSADEHEKETTTGQQHVIKKVPIKLIIDKSKEPIGLTHYLAMALWLGWPSFYLLLMLTFPFLYWYARPLLAAILAMLAASALYPIDSRKQPQWAMNIGAAVMKAAPAYFSLRIFCEDYDAVVKCSPALFSMEPHDILPISIFSFSGILSYFPPHNSRGCLSSACFMLPGMRHIYAWGGAADVNKKSIMRNLAKGYSLAMCPGGAHEVCYMTDNSSKEIVVYLKNRMGMIKMAALNGVPIVPTFTFNQRDAFAFWIPQWRWLHKLGRKIGFIPLMFSGIWGIPYAMPAPTPLNLVVGAPIMVPKMEGVLTEEMLRPYQLQFIAATERLFENNKHQFNMGDMTLKII